LWYGSPQWQIEALWRFQIPEEMAKKYGYPMLTARIFKLKPIAPVSKGGLYKPVPPNFESMIPGDLKRRLADEPGYRGYTELLRDDKLSKLKADYVEAGGLRENLRYGWVRRG